MMLTSGVMEGFALDMLQRELSAALAYHQRGELVRAQELYRGLLQRFPDSFDALHLLGVATVDLGAAGTGIEFIRRAIALDPTQANARCSLAQALLASGDRAAALAALDDATAVQPEFAAPNAILWLREGSPAMQGNLAREATSRGVDPARLVHAPRVVGVQEHQARFALADLFLDTTPYNAHTTASEALAAAVPVITQPGRSFASRVATSLLHAVGLGHLSVADAPRYERLAIDLARSPADLAALKAHLRRVRSSAPLFDAQRFCRHLEDAFTEVIGRQRRSLPPLTLAVQARERSGPMNFS
jgi:tetratricopeptide (TPR) repeat protein